MITDFSKIAFAKIMFRSGYAQRDHGWGKISLSSKKWPKIDFKNTIFHKSFEDECTLILVEYEKVLLGIVDGDAITHPISETRFVILNHEFYRRLELTLVNVSDLLPIEEHLDDVVPRFMETVPNYPSLKDLKPDFQCYFPGRIQGTCVAEKELFEGINHASFEGGFHSIDEILISHATCIYQFLPSKGRINILPLNWLNRDLLNNWDIHSYGFSRDPDSRRIFGFLHFWNPQGEGPYKMITKYVRLNDTDTKLDSWLNLV